jgi:hypothetical protein
MEAGMAKTSKADEYCAGAEMRAAREEDAQSG